jgi:branched-chain amino acid transport system permease protein
LAFAQLLFNGFALGMAYALVALGFVLVLNAVNAVNFAQGDLVMAGGYLGVALAAVLPVPAIVMLPAVLAAVAVIGLVLSLVAYFPIMRRPPAAVFISTIAFGVILRNGYQLVFGPEAHAVEPLFSSGVWELGKLVISKQAAAIIVTAAVLMGIQYYVMERTQFGRRLRATAQNRNMAAALGIPVLKMIAVTFAAGAALGGAAGLMLGNQFLVYPTGGINLIITAYIAAVIGGWGSLGGAVLGAMLIALFQVIVSAYVSYTAATAMLYLVVLLVLFFRPQGLLGRGEQRRV